MLIIGFLAFFLCCAPLSTLAADWENLKSPHFYIHYQSRDSRLAQILAKQAEPILQKITDDVGYTPSRKMTIYLCPTPACFSQQQPSNVKLPQWAVGVAYPQFSRIVIRSALTRSEKGNIKPLEIFTHEVAHIVIEQALSKRGGAPRWLSEGFSMYHARQWTVHGQRTMEEVTLGDKFIPLLLLTTSFPRDENAARIAYAQSFSLVAFLLNDRRYGKYVFHKFIDNLKTGMDANSALYHAARSNLTRLEREWQESLKQRHSWLSYLSNVGFLWFLFSLIFLLAYIVKRWRVRRIQKRWEEEDVEDDFPDMLR